MDRFCVVAMREKPEIEQAAEQIQKYLEQRGCVCRINTGYVERKNIAKDTQCAIVLGGDGTLLQAARELVETDIRLIGINFGNLGFLAEVEKDDITETLEKLIHDDYFVEKRMLLNGKIVRAGRVVMENAALNDIVINRSSLMKVMQLKISVNGMLLSKYHADGIIIATPTGSTAYSMSAGGPIVKPSAELIVMTPICPHTLNTRSIILDSEDVIEIEVSSKRDYDNDVKKVFFDGDDNIELEKGDLVVIERSRLSVGIIKLKSRSFLEILGKKMGVHEGTET
jgi:NAD+ kinase